MRYSIGLDLGINNVGWAVYDLSSQEIIDKGVVRYKESSNAQDRRGIRGSRRLNKRRHHRVERLAEFLNSISFNTKRTYEVDLLEKRVLGLSEKISEQEITNIIYYFAIHRGYIPFDDEKTDREVYECKENEYPCQCINEFYSKYNKYRGVAELILMKDNIKELRKILEVQSKYYSKLNSENIEKIIEIISSKREFWEGPGNHYENQLSPYGRYKNLDDLNEYLKDPNYHKYLYEILIGTCDLSIDKFGNIDHVAPVGNYFAEEFNFYNDFINMKIKNVDLITEEYFDKFEVTSGKLTSKAIEEFKQYILTNKSVDFKKMINKVLGTTEDNMEGYRIDKNRKPEISKFEIFKYIGNQFKEKGLNPTWLLDDDKTVYNEIIYVLTVAPSLLALPDMLKERVKNNTFSEEEIEVLKLIKQKKSDVLKRYHSLSESILKKSLNDIKRFDCQFNFMQIMKKLDYEKEMKEYFEANYTKQTKSPYYIEDDNVDGIIANPQVKKTLRKAIKVINAIIKQYKEYPETIIVESAKEMNGKERKLRIESEQRIYDKLNKESIEILRQNNYQVTSKNIDKVIYWLETNKSCAYCGKPISLDKVLQSDIEHILPKSKTMDSSSDNLICSCVECNKIKSNRTPYEFLTSLNLYDNFKNRVLTQYKNISDKKKDNLLFEGNIEKYSIKFINRNLRDTAYGSVALINELNRYNIFLNNKEGYKINIISSPGQLTSKIRKGLDIQTKDRKYLYHHAVDAMILASLCDTPLGRVLIDSQNDPQYWIKVKKQKQHDDIWYMLEHLSLVNSNQIKKFNNDCDNQPEEDKERLLKRSYEVLRNPLKGFADANYAKFIKINDDYYVIKNISNIYDIIFQKDEKNKKLFDKLFDTNNKTVMLLCEKNDTKLFEKLKKIYSQYKNSINPFKEYCLFEKGIEAQNVKFEYLIHGIKKNDNPNSPVVAKLRYVEKANNPYLFENIKMKKKNKYQEFIKSDIKVNTNVGLTTLSQVCTRIFYSNTSKKFIFLPICAISFKNKKIDTNEKYYKETYNRIIGNDEVIEICDIYCGEWVGCINKNGEYLEGRYSCYHKTNKVLVYNYNGLNFDKYISPNIESIIIYTTDILGNRYVRVDTRNIL